VPASAIAAGALALRTRARHNAGPGTSVEDVIAVTEAALIIPDSVPEMRL